MSNKDKLKQQKEPLCHQKEAIDNIIELFQTTDRATAVMACGTGKTLVALWVAEKLNAKSIVVFVPSLALVKQLLEDWLDATSWIKPEVMVICSNNSVVDYDVINLDEDECNFPITTSATEVKKFLGSKTKAVKLVIATYHSGNVLAEAINDDFKFDFGFFDEAHRTAQSTDAAFASGLLNKNIPIKKRLFMTATPKHSSLQKKNSDSIEIYSMDNEAIYGSVAHTLSFREAVERNIICDYKVIVSVVNSQMVSKQIQDNEDAEHAAKRIAVEMAIKEFQSKKIITFHKTISQAKHFADSMRKEKFFEDVEVGHINGSLPAKLRQSYMKEFKDNNKALLTNARCLVEGIDIPAVDMISFMDKKSSQIDIVQVVGRAMRKNGNKKLGYVLIPLFLDQTADESFESAFERTGYETVMEILNAMQEQDVEFMEAISSLKYNAKNLNYNSLKSKLQILGASSDFKQLQEAILLKVIESFSSSWDDMYNMLLEFKEEYGHYNVPIYYKRDGKQLGEWVSKQRTRYRKGCLVEKRKALLDKLGFCWNVLDSSWYAKFEQLKKFKEKNGHCNIPQAGQYKKTLGPWVNKLRLSYKEGRLLEEKKVLLDQLGFCWEGIYEDLWYTNFEKLKKFKEKHGHCNVPREYEKKDKVLVAWVYAQRNSYAKDILLKERKILLNQLGFCWDTLEELWYNNFEQLKAFKEKNGHCNISQAGEYKKSLQQWINRQRLYYKKGTLRKDRKALLDKLGFCWNLSSKSTSERYNSNKIQNR
ncbi:MAG: type restriction protein res subunit [Rickettsiaceae bacterium]|nr:type restriction protein res subunit [Rickettsiaceae bacterium]